MPIIQMNIMEGRTPEQKRRVAAAVTEVVARELACNPESIRILIHELAPDGFYVNGQTLAERNAAKAQEKTQ